MKPLVTVYIAVGVFGLFFGQIQGDLLSLGLRQEVVNIVSKAIGALVLGIGAYALSTGVSLPPLPQRERE